MARSGEQLGSQVRGDHGDPDPRSASGQCDQLDSRTIRYVVGVRPVDLFPELLLAVELRSVLPDARRWFCWPLAECLVASQAAVGGPSTALALAGSLRDPISFCR